MPNPFTPAEISQILEEFFKVVGTRQYIGARYVPIFGRKGEDSIVWDNTKPYEPLTIVLYQGNSYTSRQYVPTGVEITNDDFWAKTGNYNAQIEQYRQDVLNVSNQIEDALETVDSEIDRLKETYFLADLNVCVFGDSTSQYNTNADGTTGKSTPEMLADITNCTISNYGVNGACICPDSYNANSDTIKSIFWQVHERNDLSTYDAFVIFGGTNDVQNGNDFYRTTNDAKAVRYAMQRIIQRIQTNAPNAPIVWVSPYAMYSNPSSMRSTNAMAAVNVMKCVLNSLSIPMVDMFNASGVSYTNVATVMQNSGDESNPVYVHPYEALRKRSAFAIANAITGGYNAKAFEQGPVVASVATATTNPLSATLNSIIDYKCLAFTPFHLLYTLPNDDPCVIASNYPIAREGSVFTVAGYMLTDNGTVLVQVKNSNSNEWITVGRIRGFYSGHTNFAITIDSRVLQSIGISPTDNLFISIGIKGEDNTQIYGGLLFDGYFNGDAVYFGYNKDTVTDNVYQDGDSIRYIGTYPATTDAEGTCNALPDVFNACREAFTCPVAYQNSQGTRGIALLNTLNKKLYGSDGTLLTNWSGNLFLNIAVKNYWK